MPTSRRRRVAVEEDDEEMELDETTAGEKENAAPAAKRARVEKEAPSISVDR